jgi:hypothetical protein
MRIGISIFIEARLDGTLLDRLSHHPANVWLRRKNDNLYIISAGGSV